MFVQDCEDMRLSYRLEIIVVLHTLWEMTLGYWSLTDVHPLFWYQLRQDLAKCDRGAMKCSFLWSTCYRDLDCRRDTILFVYWSSAGQVLWKPTGIMHSLVWHLEYWVLAAWLSRRSRTVLRQNTLCNITCIHVLLAYIQSW